MSLSHKKALFCAVREGGGGEGGGEGSCGEGGGEGGGEGCGGEGGGDEGDGGESDDRIRLRAYVARVQVRVRV